MTSTSWACCIAYRHSLNRSRIISRELKAILKKPAPAPAPPDDAPTSEEEAFQAAMSQVAPLKPGPKQTRPQWRPKAPQAVDEDSEVLAQLADLVSGTLPLDVRDTDEYVEGAQWLRYVA